MQVNECNSLTLGRCEIDREGEHEDRGDEEQGQPVQEPDHRVENAEFGIAVGPQHPYTSLSWPCRVGGRGDRSSWTCIHAPPLARAEFCGERMPWLRESAERYAG